MKAKHILYPVLLVMLSISGCIGPNPFFPTTEEKLDKVNLNKTSVEKEMEEQTKQFVTGAKELIENQADKPEYLLTQDKIALDFVTQAERLLGGEPIEKIDIKQLVELYETNVEKYNNIIKEKEKIVTFLRKNEESYEAKIEALQVQLQREMQQKKGFGGWLKGLSFKFIFWAIVIIILLAIFCPQLLGVIVAKIPSLITLFGITSVRVLKGVVKGVQEAREAVAELPDNSKLTKTEILELFDNKLKVGADQETEKAVKFLKTKMCLPSVTKLLRKQSSLREK